uniref:Adhesion G-protein coupled receptor G1 n=1 Tax=Nothoprocta perdicaria TaxID=30464 RepID=A0A8C7ECM8_NOTPE
NTPAALLPATLRPGTPLLRSHQEDFRFCGERNQTENSSVIYEHGPATISIENTAQALTIKRPFLPSHRNTYYKYNLPLPLGRYRFCVYWFKPNRTLKLVYGKQHFLLGKDLSHNNIRSKENQKTEKNSSSIFNVSYIMKGPGEGQAMTSLKQRVFIGTGHGAPLFFPGWMMEAFRAKLVSAVFHSLCALLFPNSKLQEFEKKLAKVEFEGQNRTFGQAAMHATVLKIEPGHAPQDVAFASQREVSSCWEKEAWDLCLRVPGSSRCLRAWQLSFPTLPPSPSLLPQDENSSRVLGDKVVGISLVDTVVANLSDPVVLTFFHKQLPVGGGNSLIKPFHSRTLSLAANVGNWNSYGCTTVKGDKRTDCRCNHLTYFAVLMISSPEITYIHRAYLSIITYVGCLISALASICTIFFLYFRSPYALCVSKQRDQITSMHIHMNLLCAIFLLDVNFLISEHLASSSSEATCRAGGLFLHFSLLSCLTWMGIEGYNLYRLVIEVFNAYHNHFLLKLCLVGWGIPFFCVMLIFFANWTNYGPFSIPVYESIGGKSTNATICWITSPLIHNVVNLGFFSLVFLFNSVMLGAMVREILRQNKKGHKMKHVLALFGLSVLLGIPWALVFFSFTSGVFRLVSLYIFTTINSLQGESVAMGSSERCKLPQGFCGVLRGPVVTGTEKLALADWPDHSCILFLLVPQRAFSLTLSCPSPRFPHLPLVLDNGAAGKKVH